MIKASLQVPSPSERRNTREILPQITQYNMYKFRNKFHWKRRKNAAKKAKRRNTNTENAANNWAKQTQIQMPTHEAQNTDSNPKRTSSRFYRLGRDKMADCRVYTYVREQWEWVGGMTHQERESVEGVWQVNSTHFNRKERERERDESLYI